MAQLAVLDADAEFARILGWASTAAEALAVADAACLRGECSDLHTPIRADLAQVGDVRGDGLNRPDDEARHNASGWAWVISWASEDFPE